MATPQASDASEAEEDVSPGGDGSLLKTILKQGKERGPQALTTPSPLCEITMRVREENAATQTTVVWPRQHHGAEQPPGLPPQLRVGVETMRLGEVARITHVDFDQTPSVRTTFDVEVVTWDEALVMNSVTKRIVKRPPIQAWREPRALDRVVVRGFLGNVDYGPLSEDWPDPSLTAPPIKGQWRLDEDTENGEGRPISAGLEECVKTMRVGEVCEVVIGEDRGTIELAQLLEDPDQALISHRGAWAEPGDAERRSKAVDALRAMGNTHLKKGDLQKAIRRYDRALEVADDGGGDDGDNYLMEDSEDAQQASKAAYEAGKEAVKRRSRATLSNRALAHLKSGDALQAKLDCEAVLKEDESHVKCKFRRAQALVELGSIEQACDVFKALMEVPSLQREARAGLVNARKMLKAHRDAERDLFRGKIKAVPENPVAKPPRKNALERTVVASLAGRRAVGRAASDAY